MVINSEAPPWCAGILTTYCLKEDGNLYSWGYNGLGLVGDGTTTNEDTPTINATNVIEAVKLAKKLKLRTVALTGKDGGTLAAILNESDIEIRVPSESTARIQETHITIAHILCELVDRILFPEQF